MTNIARVIDKSARLTGIARRDITGPYRSQDIVRARYAAIYAVRLNGDKSLPQIARAFGNRDHTTIMHACKWARAKVSADPSFACLVSQLWATAA